ncbi:MAG: hypothetical protein MZV63_33895 [Marinilabiliales bacterium]|nr:hypothetical protein [Marinilabiliales bacterium]
MPVRRPTADPGLPNGARVSGNRRQRAAKSPSRRRVVIGQKNAAGMGMKATPRHPPDPFRKPQVFSLSDGSKTGPQRVPLDVPKTCHMARRGVPAKVPPASQGGPLKTVWINVRICSTR